MSPDHVTFECVLSNKLLLQSRPDKEETPAAPRATAPLRILYGLPTPVITAPRGLTRQRQRARVIECNIYVSRVQEGDDFRENPL